MTTIQSPQRALLRLYRPTPSLDSSRSGHREAGLRHYIDGLMDHAGHTQEMRKRVEQ